MTDEEAARSWLRSTPAETRGPRSPRQAGRRAQRLLAADPRGFRPAVARRRRAPGIRAYQHYVPLRGRPGENEEMSGFIRRQSGYSVRGKESQPRLWPQVEGPGRSALFDPSGRGGDRPRRAERGRAGVPRAGEVGAGPRLLENRQDQARAGVQQVDRPRQLPQREPHRSRGCAVHGERQGRRVEHRITMNRDNRRRCGPPRRCATSTFSSSSSSSAPSARSTGLCRR
jgi:hypothetical protein